MTYRESDQYELILKEVKTKKAKIKKKEKKNNLYLMTYWRLRTWTPTQRNVRDQRFVNVVPHCPKFQKEIKGLWTKQLKNRFIEFTFYFFIHKNFKQKNFDTLSIEKMSSGWTHAKNSAQKFLEGVLTLPKKISVLMKIV